MRKKLSKDAVLLEYEPEPGTPKDTVKPMLNVVPNWYKELQRHLKTPYGEFESIKACVPFLDSLTTGYYIALSQDVFIEQTENGPVMRWAKEPQPGFNRPPGQTGKMPAPAGYSPEHLIWHTKAAVRLPDGYSALFTHPLNRFDLPFITLSGVVDGPFVVQGGNIPFHVKEGFEGLIEEGTPILQIIPFLRENWQSKEVEGTWDEGQEQTASQDYAKGTWYRRRKWHKKTYK
jgi:hypothetical protein